MEYCSPASLSLSSLFVLQIQVLDCVYTTLTNKTTEVPKHRLQRKIGRRQARRFLRLTFQHSSHLYLTTNRTSCTKLPYASSSQW